VKRCNTRSPRLSQKLLSAGENRMMSVEDAGDPLFEEID